MKKIITIKKTDEEIRIDRWLKINFSTLNQSFIEKKLRKGFIKLNSKKTKANKKLKKGDEIIIFDYLESTYKNISKKIITKDIPFETNKLFKKSIIFENNNFIILNKWSGIATQGGSKIKISIDDIIKKISVNYNLVHRLDRETSGLLIIAKNLNYTRIFGEMFKLKTIKKNYLAICEGIPKKLESNVNLKIFDKKSNQKETKTKYKVLITNKGLSTILFVPLTGKTHQIRIVAKFLNCPIVGDTKYNITKRYSFEKLKLNAYSLVFDLNNKTYNFLSTLPKDFTDFSIKNNLGNQDYKYLINS